ncbi:MAG TPA: universal stress protein [Candidatus Baltobacteraceae bacterium]|jgi:nucleotide-binding universal stress UspA family protein|nr:universal stress protein [Candidatus Baltobacteraceae bacterium]
MQTLTNQTNELQTSLGLKNVVFGTDFSPASVNALSYAAELAARFHAALHAVNAADPANYSLPPETWHTADEARELEMKKLRAHLQTSFPDVDSEVETWEGTVSQVLASAIDRDRADLVVLGTHGRTGLGKLLRGSSAEEILRTAPCPVLTIGPQVSIAQKWQPNDILYATDFSPASLSGARYAIALAHEYKARLTLLHVVEGRKVDELVHESDLIASSKRLLRNLVPDGALHEEPRCEVKQGAPADTILEAARSVNAGLIVLGAHRSSGVPGAASHLPIATVHKVIAHAPCPVLTVRH